MELDQGTTAQPPLRWPLSLLVGDVLVATISYYFAIWTAQALSTTEGESIHSAYVFAVIPLWVLGLGAAGGYRRRTFTSLRRTIRASLLGSLYASAIIICIVLYTEASFPSQLQLGTFSSVLCLLGVAERWLFRMLFICRARRMLIIGEGEVANQLAKGFSMRGGYEVVGFLSTEDESTSVLETELLGAYVNFVEILVAHAPIHDVLVTVPPKELCAWQQLLALLDSCGITVWVPARFVGPDTFGEAVESVSGSGVPAVPP